MLERLHRSDEDLIGKKVLVVDDDVRNIFALSSVLERRGASTVSPAPGTVARRPIPQQKFAGLARQMYDDPNLTGDVLHFALAVAEMLTRSDTDFRREAWTAELSLRVAGRPDWARYAVRSLPATSIRGGTTHVRRADDPPARSVRQVDHATPPDGSGKHHSAPARPGRGGTSGSYFP